MSTRLTRWVVFFGPFTSMLNWATAQPDCVVSVQPIEPQNNHESTNSCPLWQNSKKEEKTTGSFGRLVRPFASATVRHLNLATRPGPGTTHSKPRGFSNPTSKMLDSREEDISGNKLGCFISNCLVMPSCAALARDACWARTTPELTAA